MNWRSTPFLLLACLLVPPVGLVLLWLRPRPGVVKKLFGTLAIAAISIVHLVVLFGLRVELEGSGTRPIFTFRSKDRHYADLERSRAEQAKLPVLTAESAPATVSAAAPEPVAAPEAAATPKPVPAALWTDFRGPRRDGIYSGEILTVWPSKGLERLWKQPVGGGYASFVFGEGKAFTIEQRRDKEVVTAYDMKSGKEIWAHSYPAEFKESMGGDGPRATPTYHEGVVYSLGAIGELRVLDAGSGKLKWQKNILTDNHATNLMWGMSASPLIVDDKVIVQPGGPGGKSMVAYAKATGERVWSSLDDMQAYCSPMLVTFGGKRQILTMTAKRVVGLAPEDGKLIWEYPWITQYDVNSAQPILLDQNRLFVSSGYGHGAALIEVKATSTGLEASKIWENTRMKNRFNSSVLHEGHIYGLDENILACVRASDGQLMWKGGRYGYGQLLLASGHLVVISEEGELVLLKATPEKQAEVAKFAAIDGKTWNVPAIENGLLFVRNSSEMACFRIGK